MPTYGYKCKACSFEFDEFQTISDIPLVVCPECNAPSLMRVIGAGAGFVFKGSGFYLTDYKNKSQKQEKVASTPDTSSDAKSEKAAPAKKDTQPA
jgi:putative FmdB family regulatory protein